jgi:hypothetical protein
MQKKDADQADTRGFMIRVNPQIRVVFWKDTRGRSGNECWVCRRRVSLGCAAFPNRSDFLHGFTQTIGIDFSRS